MGRLRDNSAGVPGGQGAIADRHKAAVPRGVGGCAPPIPAWDPLGGTGSLRTRRISPCAASPQLRGLRAERSPSAPEMARSCGAPMSLHLRAVHQRTKCPAGCGRHGALDGGALTSRSRQAPGSPGGSAPRVPARRPRRAPGPGRKWPVFQSRGYAQGYAAASPCRKCLRRDRLGYSAQRIANPPSPVRIREGPLPANRDPCPMRSASRSRPIYQPREDPEVLEWWSLTPAQRFVESQELWQTFVLLGGSLDPEPDWQSPFYFEDASGPRPAHGRSGVHRVRRRRVQPRRRRRRPSRR